MGFKVQTGSPKLKHKMVAEDIFDKMSFYMPGLEPSGGTST